MEEGTELFVSVDIETAGPNPADYSLLAIGACLVADPTRTFYVELRPINDQAAEEAGLVRYVCAAWIEKGELALRRGALTEARTSCDRAKIQARDIGENALEARALFGLARVAADQASPEAAEELAAESLSIYQKLGSCRQQEVQQFLEERRR